MNILLRMRFPKVNDWTIKKFYNWRHLKNGIEFWFARDLQHLLGYAEWRNFNKVISKAKTACETAGYQISDYFVDINKTIAMPKGAAKEIPLVEGNIANILLTKIRGKKPSFLLTEKIK